MSMISNGRWNRVFAGWSCIACVAAVGCDAQVSPRYRGEPLLTLMGSVELTQQRPEGELVPALLFPQGGGGSTFDVVDVNVKGTFPSDFVLDVYDPPPTLPKVDPRIGDPSATIGYITAVPKDHPPTRAYATYSSLGYSAECTSTPCEGNCPPCKLDGTWCAGDDCYYEDLSCPTLETPRDQCTVTRMEGDPALRHPWKLFAGFSSNYVVVYLSGAVPADSYTGRALNAPHALEPGYHLLGIRKDTEEENEERHACRRRVQQTALDRENERLGTDYSYEEVFDYACQEQIDDCNSEGAICEPPPPQVPSRLCDRPEEELDSLLEAVDEMETQLMLDLDCPLGRWRMTYIEDPSQERIKVELTPESNPLFNHARNVPADW